MTASRAPRRAAARGLAALALAAVLVAPAAAQVQLVPGAAPRQAAPSPVQPGAPEGVAVEELGGLDSEAVGALSASEAGLPDALWTDLSRASITALIDGLPTTTGFPGGRDLAKRLLLFGGALPPEDSDTTVSVLRARISALARLGFARDAGNLAAAGADALTDPAGRRAVAEAQLVADDLPGACGAAVNAGDAPEPDLFWQKLLAFCQAVAGQSDQASLSAQTLLDLGVDDPVYFGLMDALTLDLSPDLGGRIPAGPLHTAMLRVTEAPLPVALVDGPDPGIALEAARRASPLSAAEAAAVRGIMSAEELAERYGAERFKASALEAPLEVLDRVSAPAARALLYQVASTWDNAPLKAEAVAEAVARARADGVLMAVAPLFRAVVDFPATADLLWFAEDAARLFYLSGDVEAARRWHGLLRDAAAIDPNAAVADAGLWHLAVLSGETGAALGRSRAGWEDAIRTAERDDVAGDARVAFLSALVRAATVGDAISTDATTRAAALAAPTETGVGASAALLQLLDRAAANKRVGEVAVLSLAALAAAPPDALAPGTMVAAIRALAEVGLQEDARRLAIEAAVLSAAGR
jgi:hypothetical protein